MTWLAPSPAVTRAGTPAGTDTASLLAPPSRRNSTVPDGLDFAQGASDISVALPRPSGTVLLRLEGGASQVTVGGASYSGIAAGTVITQPGWAAATGRIDIDATSGVSQLQVTQG